MALRINKIYTFKRNFELLDSMAVYVIENIVDGKCYIGATTVTLQNRVRDHFKCLRSNKHKNCHLQEAYNLFGEEVFKITTLYKNTPTKEILYILEGVYADIFNACDKDFGYNLDTPGLFKKHCAATKKQISKENKGKTVSKEGRQRMSEAQKAYVHSKRPGYIPTHLLGIAMSEESKKKISEKAKERHLNNPDLVKPLLVAAKEKRHLITEKLKIWNLKNSNPASRPVICYNISTGQEMFFWCVKNAAEVLGLNKSSIQKQIRREKFNFSRHPYLFSYLKIA